MHNQWRESSKRWYKTRDCRRKWEEVEGLVVDEEGRWKRENQDDEVSCRCSMILREYQRIAKKTGYRK